jgi:hypothetical protein
MPLRGTVCQVTSNEYPVFTIYGGSLRIGGKLLDSWMTGCSFDGLVDGLEECLIDWMIDSLDLMDGWMLS